MPASSDALAERGAIDSAAAALAPYDFYRVHERGEVSPPALVGGIPAAALDPRSLPSLPRDRPCVLLSHSTETFRRLARSVPSPGEYTVDVGSAHGDATALMARAAGPDRVLGLDVAHRFVSAARAKHPGLAFERLDALEDPAFLAQRLAGAVNVFVDVGGVRAAEALVRLLPAVASASPPPTRVVVKCEALAKRAKSLEEDEHRDEVDDAPLGSSRDSRLVRVREEASVASDGSELESRRRRSPHRTTTAARLGRAFWRRACEDEVRNARARSTFRATHVVASAAPGSRLFARYPLKYPERRVDAPGTPEHGAEMCRFHNYAADGCLRFAAGRCDLNHERCHWCGEVGHRAFACEAAREAAVASVVHPGLAPTAAPVRDPDDGAGRGGTGESLGSASGPGAGRVGTGESANPRDDETVPHRGDVSPGSGDVPRRGDGDVPRSGASFLYVVGGRNRGQTVGVAERLNLSTLEWERAPRLNDPRGSHGLAAAGNVLYAVAGGGVRSNLHTAESLRPSEGDGGGVGGGVVGGAVVGDAGGPSPGPGPSPVPDGNLSWSPAGVVAEARHAVAACATGDWGVYVLGGWGNGDASTGAVDFLDLREDDPGLNAGAFSLRGGRGFAAAPGTRAWRSLAPLRLPRKLHAAAGLPDGRLLVFGGRASDEPGVGPVDAVEAYDPTRDEWRFVAPLPGGGACASAAVDDDHRVYVLTWGATGGGDDSHMSANRVEKKARKAGKAAEAEATARGASPGEAAAARKAAVEAFRRDASSRTRTRGEIGGLWRYDPDANAYELLGGLPLPEWYGFAAAAGDGWVYAAGGSVSGRWTGAAFRFRVADAGAGAGAGVWEELPSMKMVRRRTAAAVVKM